MSNATSELKRLINSIKKNARPRGLEVAVEYQDLLQLWVRSGGKCAVSGLPFDMRKCVGSKRRPFAMSVDRIDSSKGYTKDNCRLVCVAVNYAMGDWGQEVLERIAFAIVGAKRDIPIEMRGERVVGMFPGIMHRKTPTGGIVYEAYIRDESCARKRRYLGRFHNREDAMARIRAEKAGLQEITAAQPDDARLSA